jgi:hypothetical protein
MLLASQANSKIYIQKSVRVFINLIWQNYQFEIVKKVFLPYCIYMSIIMWIGSYHLGRFLDLLDSNDDHETIRSTRVMVWILTVVCTAFIAFFVLIEYLQIKQNANEYFRDYWNYIDGIGLLLNGILMIMLNVNCINESNEAFPKHNLRMIGALGVFLLWVKLFYWMRLFRSTAYFITLVTEVILDIRVFMVMLFIMLCAFASFFKIINKNTPGY